MWRCGVRVVAMRGSLSLRSSRFSRMAIALALSFSAPVQVSVGDLLRKKKYASFDDVDLERCTGRSRSREMKAAVLVLVPLLFAISSCVPTQNTRSAQSINWYNSSEIANSIRVTYDEYKKITKYEGPAYPGMEYVHKVFLRAWRHDGSSEITCQIYVSSEYEDPGYWYNFQQAYDSDGNMLDTMVIGYDMKCPYYGCQRFEDVGINVGKGYLENHKTDGVKFKLDGKNNAVVLSVPSSYIAAFLYRIGPGPDGDTAQGDEFIRYYNTLINTLRRNWVWAGDANAGLSVSVGFSVRPDGSLAGVRLLSESGNADFDRSVENAVRSAGMIEPPPDRYRKEFSEVIIQFNSDDLANAAGARKR